MSLEKFKTLVQQSIDKETEERNLALTGKAKAHHQNMIDRLRGRYKLFAKAYDKQIDEATAVWLCLANPKRWGFGAPSLLIDGIIYAPRVSTGGAPVTTVAIYLGEGVPLEETYDVSDHDDKTLLDTLIKLAEIKSKFGARTQGAP